MKQRVTFLILFAGMLLPLPNAFSQTETVQEQTSQTDAATDKDPVDLSVPLKDGAVEFTASKNWKRKKPRSSIIAHEFSTKSAEGDEKPGRITVMAAMGSIDANIARWKKQFVPPQGKSADDITTVTKTNKDGNTFHVVDISGTYMDQPKGPFGPKVEQAGYRMLGAIVTVKDEGQFFLKFYGPKKTVDAEEKAFREFVNSLNTES